MTQFPVSGVETHWWLPMLVAFAISVFTSTGGLSGAFLLLPFQVSILGFAGPGVSPTNLIFNIVAIPSGVYRYYREKRMVWPIVGAVITGTLPGVFLGAIIRIKYLQDPRAFKLFVGLVLLYMGIRIALDAMGKSRKADIKLAQTSDSEVTQQFFNLKQTGFSFGSEKYAAPTWGIILLSLFVGIIGGIYGIGGGAIIAPFLVAVFGLPVHAIAGAALLGTFVTSGAGIIFYAAIAPFYAGSGLNINPDWLLGGLFGIGGAAGMYIGARLQRYLSAKLIKAMLTLCLLFVAITYIVEFFS